MRPIAIISFFFILAQTSCRKVQLIPDKLSGHWMEIKAVNVSTQTEYDHLSGNYFHFTNKKYSIARPHPKQEWFYSYIFTPDEKNPENGKIEFKGGNIVRPDTFTISWSGDTLIMTPLDFAYDIRYYLRQQ